MKKLSISKTLLRGYLLDVLPKCPDKYNPVLLPNGKLYEWKCRKWARKETPCQFLFSDLGGKQIYFVDLKHRNCKNVIKPVIIHDIIEDSYYWSYEGSNGDPNCTFTLGAWKNNPDTWREESLTLGEVYYDKNQLLAILKEPVRGNGLIALAHQLIATKLNIAYGADPTVISDTIGEADASIQNLVIPPVGGDRLHPSKTSFLMAELAKFNKGEIGPGHCPGEPLPP